MEGPGIILFTVKMPLSNPSAGTQCGRKQSVWLNGQLKQALLMVLYDSTTNWYSHVLGEAFAVHEHIHSCFL